MSISVPRGDDGKWKSYQVGDTFVGDWFAKVSMTWSVQKWHLVIPPKSHHHCRQWFWHTFVDMYTITYIIFYTYILFHMMHFLIWLYDDINQLSPPRRHHLFGIHPSRSSMSRVEHVEGYHSQSQCTTCIIRSQDLFNSLDTLYCFTKTNLMLPTTGILFHTWGGFGLQARDFGGGHVTHSTGGSCLVQEEARKPITTTIDMRGLGLGK